MIDNKTTCPAMNMPAFTRTPVSIATHLLTTLIAVLMLSACGSAPVQTRSSAEPPSVTAYQPTGIVIRYPIYLKKAGGHWIAALTGNPGKDKDTEMIYVSAVTWSYYSAAMPPENGEACRRKDLDREASGYMTCNSAFYAAKVGKAAAGAVLRGILSMGIFTVVEAANGATPFGVEVDQEALDRAVEESGAVVLAQQSAQLFDYREAFRLATTAAALEDFVHTYEGSFDPEALVAAARKKLPVAMEKEAWARQAKAREEEQQAELARERERQQKIAEAELAAFPSHVKRGDRVMVETTDRLRIYGLVVEVKAPLAYVQWENKSPAQEWVRLDWLRPPQGQASIFLRRD